MTKTLLVASQVQANLLTEFLINEIQHGFWVGQRPTTHGNAWDDVVVEVTQTNTVGPQGDFKPQRFYDFLNPEFTKIHQERLVSIAKAVKPAMTFKSLKKELIELGRIIGGRMTDKTQEPARVFRGNNRSDYDVIRVVDRQKVVSVAGVKAMVEKAVKTVKKTAIKKTDGITTSTTADGTVVRRSPIVPSSTPETN